jgi:hypothetical protein
MRTKKAHSTTNFLKVTNSIIADHVKWERTDDPYFPFRVNYCGVECKIRLNDFPDEQLYTLVIEDNDTLSFSTWPQTWARPTRRTPRAEAASIR